MDTETRQRHMNNGDAGVEAMTRAVIDDADAIHLAFKSWNFPPEVGEKAINALADASAGLREVRDEVDLHIRSCALVSVDALMGRNDAEVSCGE